MRTACPNTCRARESPKKIEATTMINYICQNHVSNVKPIMVFMVWWNVRLVSYIGGDRIYGGDKINILIESDDTHTHHTHTCARAHSLTHTHARTHTRRERWNIILTQHQLTLTEGEGSVQLTSLYCLV
jgi:hypothetical protein